MSRLWNRRPHGFTLLEVSVALAILALGLVSVIDLNSGATRLHEASQHMTVGTLLAKAKMIDLEQKYNEDGFSDFDQQIDGVFDEQGHPEIRWHAEILRPDVSKATDQITQLVTGALGGGSAAGAQPAGSNPLAGLIGGSSLIPAGTQLPGSSASSSSADGPTVASLGGALGAAEGGLIQMEVTQLVQQIQNAVREVRLTVTWPDGAHEDSLSVATHFVILQPTGRGVSAGTPNGQGTSQNGGTPGGTTAGSLPGATGNPLGNLLGGSLGGLH
jgi:general secretion pathway protein I